MLCATLPKGATATHALAPGRHAYLVPARGAVTVNGATVNARDGCAIADETNLNIAAVEDAELVLIDCP
jgi:redox-sensitive bicupin YhaK (pirin superfamily)